MRKLILVCLVLFLISNISAIIINEIEMNPEDDCYDCTEWVELYSDIEINLSGYWLENNKSSIINLSGIKSGYIKIDFGKRFLTNSGDKLILKKDGQIIDETPLLNDTKNDIKTWQLCDSWEFLEATKGEKNKCETEEEEEEKSAEEKEVIEKEITENISEDSEILSGDNGVESRKVQPLTPEIIYLTPKDIKSGSDNQFLDNSDYAKYGFVVFCILLGLLFILKRKNKPENEFQQKRKRNKRN